MRRELVASGDKSMMSNRKLIEIVRSTVLLNVEASVRTAKRRLEDE
jgi:hypothetical protein